MGLCITKYCHLLLSPCNYHFFAKVKEPLRGTQYITRDYNLSMLYSALYFTAAHSAEGRPASLTVRPLLARVRVCSL